MPFEMRCPTPQLTDIRTLVFDFDGTLVTCPYDFSRMRRAVVQAAMDFGIATGEFGTDLGLLECITLGVQRCGDDCWRAGEFRRIALAQLGEIEYEAAAVTELLPGMLDALQRLRAAGFRLGVITRNSAAAVARIIDGSPFPIAQVLTREDVPHPKPHPDHVVRMLTLLDATASTALMVGDHPMDIAVGKAAGVGTVAVLTGQTDAATLRAAQPDFLLPSVVELAELLLAP
jgi:phosphoglycolate phosphatase